MAEKKVLDWCARHDHADLRFLRCRGPFGGRRSCGHSGPERNRGAEARRQLVRNGSRGLLWLEPLLEVETPAGRVGYGPVTPRDVKSIFEAGSRRGA